MPNLNAADVAATWARNMTGSVQKIKAGVAAVTESPMVKAAAQVDRYVSGVQKAAQDGVWQDGLLSVSLEDWKRLTGEKGTQRISAGVTAATPKMEGFLRQLLPHAAAVSREVQALPKGTLEDSIARSNLAIRRMADFKFRRRT